MLGFNTFRRFWMVLLGFFLTLTTLALPQQAHALVYMDAKGINEAVRYGMERGRYGISELLGPNWKEHADGTLLNIYSPFMLIATQVSKKGYPANPTEKEVAKARKQNARVIRSVTNIRYPQEVKFVLSLYGNNDKFTRTIGCKLEGIGHGKTFSLTPSRRIIDRFASPLDEDENGNATQYEGVNAYYFPMKTLLHLDEYDITFYDYAEGSTMEPITFHINNRQIY